MSDGLLARGAATVKFELVVDVGKAGLSRNLLFEVSDRACKIENFHRSAVATNEVVVMMLLAKAIVRRATVKADSADYATFFESLNEAIHRCRVGVDFKVRALGNVLKREWVWSFREDSKASLQSSGPTHPGTGALFQETLSCIIVRHSVRSV